ncbi:hypothetical protein P4U05_16860 [Bacillus paranthracis]|uniref:hypothetical protein n=1 Tax=Bacillus phage phi4B1 TaxID=1643324 RepID=UPI000200F439|nr:hypothetical protein [Bacillus paranthracis]YP_009206325.1 hypothetical protein XO26_0026 [Bacillus phage phi4B1]ADY20377.1 hypothetical protein YBT020_05655 [Bacillus thuringiensis serovar finitimus YBT-020]MRC72864.1 hypothetical protein [Bacillus thuringiensis]OTX71317.1 hypothetical protein BK722_12965 [Bacillus thuringiensis serovar finitimus]PGZ50236.1 hypothetical protein COE56_15125 [Bacillus anthracis]ALF02561.1 hypothetical protein XO26_0026 [Bacillus phage phi4B1]
MKDAVKILKWVTGGLEAILGIPILGGTIVISMFWTPLVFMLCLHILTLILAKREGLNANGNILGVVTSCLAWIPIVGMIMHILSAIFIMMDAARTEQE